jgi:hypothetical protein
MNRISVSRNAPALPLVGKITVLMSPMSAADEPGHERPWRKGCTNVLGRKGADERTLRKAVKLSPEEADRRNWRRERQLNAAEAGLKARDDGT